MNQREYERYMAELPGHLLEIVKHGNRIQPGNGWLQDRDGPGTECGRDGGGSNGNRPVKAAI